MLQKSCSESMVTATGRAEALRSSRGRRTSSEAFLGIGIPLVVSIVLKFRSCIYAGLFLAEAVELEDNAQTPIKSNIDGHLNQFITPFTNASVLPLLGSLPFACA